MDGVVKSFSSVLKVACAAYCQDAELLACESPIEADVTSAFKVHPCVEVLLGATKEQLINKARTFAHQTTVIVAPQVVIGIEREPKYFDIACRRIEQAMQQPDLFIPTATKQVQEAFAL